MSHPIFFNASAMCTAVPLLFFGFNGMLRPDNHLQALGFPLHSEPKAQKLNHALMRIWGIRNISVGFLLTMIWSTGNEQLMARCLGAMLAIPLTDGFVSRALIGGGEFQHWIFLPTVTFLIAGLTGWFS